MADKKRTMSLFEKSEEAIGMGDGPTQPAETPSPKKSSAPRPLPKTLKPGTSYPLESVPLMDRSIKGSGKMSKQELKQGFRRLGGKLNYSEDGCK